jgi:preprotein translocase subunit SecY
MYSVVSLVAGATLVMWMGELITERGIGNGASLLIFIGIIASMPSYIHNTAVLLKGGTSVINLIFFLIILFGMIVSIVYVQEAERKVPIQYAKKTIGRQAETRSSTTYIPLRLIQGGVMPIIFASAMIQFPLMIGQYISIEKVQVILNSYFQYDDLFYNLLFCGLIFFFTYFYTAITFNPEEISNNIKRYGGFVLGIRPGKSTEEYLERILSKITFIGALFLAVVAMVPIGAAQITQITSFVGLGGTAILIIVGVAMDLVKQTETYIINKQYDGLLN